MASVEYGLPVFDVSAHEPRNAPRSPDRQRYDDEHHAVPLFQRGNRLFVAVSDPMNLAALDEFKFAAGMNTDRGTG
jgi:type IV pilus assembly protein PilB